MNIRSTMLNLSSSSMIMLGTMAFIGSNYAGVAAIVGVAAILIGFIHSFNLSLKNNYTWISAVLYSVHILAAVALVFINYKYSSDPSLLVYVVASVMLVSSVCGLFIKKMPNS